MGFNFATTVLSSYAAADTGCLSEDVMEIACATDNDLCHFARYINMCYWMSVVVAVLSAVAGVALFPLFSLSKCTQLVTITDIILFVIEVFPVSLQPDLEFKELRSSTATYVVCSSVSLVLMLLGVITSIGMVAGCSKKTEAPAQRPSETASLLKEPQTAGEQTPGTVSSDTPAYVADPAVQYVSSSSSSQNTDKATLPTYSVV